MPDPFCELGGPDVISGGGEDFGAFAVSRWPGLLRQAFAMTGDQRTAEDLAQVTLARAYLAWRRVRRMDDQGAYLGRVLTRVGKRRSPSAEAAERVGAPAVPEAVAVPVAPVDSIIRRGRGIRLRRVWGTAGGVGLAGVVAAAIVVRPPVTPASAPTAAAPTGPALAVTVPASGVAGADGVFARGTVDGHAWQLAVQNIADPGYRCIPAVTINGMDANPVYPVPGNGADVTLGNAVPGIGFAFVQVPDDIAGLVADGSQSLPVVTARACGLRYRLTGFAYRLTRPPRITVTVAHPGWPKKRPASGGTPSAWPAGFELPLISEPSATVPRTDGMWNNVGPTSAETAGGDIASGKAWSITLMLSVSGDCYEFSSADTSGRPQVGVCGPISTPDGAETDGSTRMVTPRVVNGRKYAAFSVSASLRLKRLAWLDASGQAFASTTELPRYGYAQFQP